ncbi:MAG: transporter suffix domain-containing protein [Phyllobacterium sp.]
MNSQVDMAEPQTNNSGWRFKCGVVLFILMIILVLMIPLAAFSGLPGSTVAAVTGMIFVANKVILILTVAVMGKSGFQQLRQSLAGYLPGLAEGPVSPTRHFIGLVMFCVPIVSAMLEPYIDYLWPGLRPNMWQLQLLGDIMLIASIFVLGGNFWGKVRALFVRTARVMDIRNIPANEA